MADQPPRPVPNTVTGEITPLDRTPRGRAPIPKAPFEADRVHTPSTPKNVFASLTRVWNSTAMQGEAAKQAVAVLMAQWGLETADGPACHNWNLAGIKSGQPDKQWHYSMETPDDFLEKEAENLVAWQLKTNPDNPKAYFKADKKLAGPGKFRVWQVAFFRSWNSIDEGSRGFLGLVSGRFSSSLQFVNAGDPEGYANSLSDDFLGKNKGWFNVASSKYKLAMRARYDRYMGMTL